MTHPLNPLEILLQVQQSGSLAQAASRLNRSASALSKTLRKLEGDAGYALVEHAARPLRLTEAGTIFAAAAHQMRDQLRRAQEQAGALDQQLGGSLRVTASVLLGHAVLADFLVKFRRSHPQLRVEVELSDENLDPLKGDFDIALRHEQGASADLIGRVLGTNRVRLCATPAYFALHGRPQTPDDLAEHPCLQFHCHPLDPRWRFRKGAETLCVVPDGPISANSDELLMASMRAGDGLLPCFDWLVGRDLREGRLQTCLDDWRFECEAYGEPELWAVYPQSQRGRPKLQCFIEALIEHLAEISATT